MPCAKKSYHPKGVLTWAAPYVTSTPSRWKFICTPPTVCTTVTTDLQGRAQGVDVAAPHINSPTYPQSRCPLAVGQ